jgi:hypothetical protein
MGGDLQTIRDQGGFEETADLITAFTRVEDTLRASGLTQSERYTLIWQLLVLRLATEEKRGGAAATALTGDVESRSLEVFESALQAALRHYRAFLPETVTGTFKCSAHTLNSLWQEVSSVSVLKSPAEVLDRLFMKFGPALAKAELGQYFSAPELVDFLIGLVNPQPGEAVIELACGTAPFMIAAHRYLKKRHGVGSTDEWVGIDISGPAADLARFNVLIHGMRARIIQADALLAVAAS